MGFYKIRVKGHLDERWSEWFDELEITNMENGEAMLSGVIVDRAALHGVLAKVRALNLRLIPLGAQYGAIEGKGERGTRIRTSPSREEKDHVRTEHH